MTMAAPRKDGQTEAIPTAHVKFTGMSASALDTPAEIGDRQTFTVVGVCIGSGKELRKDGEVRDVRKIEVESVTFGAIKKAEKEKGLFAVPGDDQDDDGDDDGIEV